MTRALFGAAMAITLALTTPASAQSSRAIVLELDGPGGRAAGMEVASTIEDGEGWSVVDGGEVDRAATRAGSDPGSREVAADVGASAVLDGRVTKRGRRYELRLRVRDASSGTTLAEERFVGRGVPGLRAEIRRTLWDRVGLALGQSRAPTTVDTRSSSSSSSRPAAAAPREAVPSAPREDADRAAPAATNALSPLWLALGITAFSRDLSYTDDLYFALRPYQLPIGFTGRGQARWYPGAHFTQDFVANIGLDVSASAAIGLRTRQRDGTMFPTESIDVRAGADLRIPLAPVELGLGLGYGIHTFALGASDAGNEPAMPDVEYQYVRPSIRARFDVGAGIYAETAFGWRVLTASGGLSTWFPRNTGSGFDLGAWIGWESDLGIGARAGFEMQRYFFSMNPEPGDTNVVGGGADQYLAGSVDLVWRPR